jgi:hypothetical protein
MRNWHLFPFYSLIDGFLILWGFGQNNCNKSMRAVTAKVKRDSSSRQWAKICQSWIIAYLSTYVYVRVHYAHQYSDHYLRLNNGELNISYWFDRISRERNTLCNVFQSVQSCPIFWNISFYDFCDETRRVASGSNVRLPFIFIKLIIFSCASLFSLQATKGSLNWYISRFPYLSSVNP